MATGCMWDCVRGRPLIVPLLRVKRHLVSGGFPHATSVLPSPSRWSMGGEGWRWVGLGFPLRLPAPLKSLVGHTCCGGQGLGCVQAYIISGLWRTEALCHPALTHGSPLFVPPRAPALSSLCLALHTSFLPKCVRPRLSVILSLSLPLQTSLLWSFFLSFLVTFVFLSLKISFNLYMQSLLNLVPSP